MNNEEKSSLLPQVMLQINAYEKGARDWINKVDLTGAAATAASLMTSPIMAFEFAMNTMDSASSTPEEIETEYKSQNLTLGEQRKDIPTKEIVGGDEVLKNSFADQDCEIVGGDSWVSNEKWKVEGKIKLGGAEIPKKVGRRFTNPVKVKLKINPLYKGHLIEERSGKTIADCFDCQVNYTAEFMYPSIEVLWEFEKLLKGILDAIKLIEKNLDPMRLYKDICNLKAFVGVNFLCPSMMGKINLMLPTLFMKYSMDLGKISFDLNFILGGLLKAGISAIATFLENIRALIIPFIDCAINAAKSVRGYIKSVASAIAQGIDQTGDLLNKGAQILHKGGLLVGEIFNDDPTGLFTESDEIQSKIKKLEEDYQKASKQLSELIVSKNPSDQEIKTYVKAIKTFEAIEFLFNSLPKKYGGQYRGEFKKNPLIVEVKKYYTSNYNQDENEFFKLTAHQFQQILSLYFEDYSDVYTIEDFNLSAMSSDQEKSLTKAKEGFSDEEKTPIWHTYKVKDQTRIQQEIFKKEKELAKKKEEIHEEHKDSLNYKMATRDKKIFDYENMVQKDMANPTESKNALYNFLKQRYSFNLQNSYVNHEYSWVKKGKEYSKKYTSGVLDDVVKLIDEYVIRSLEIIKKQVNDFFGNIINALKNLNLILDQNAFSQLKIIGEIMQLIHVIRAFALIKKLVDEGFEGCDKLNKNKEQERILRKALEEVSNNETSAEVITVEEEEGELGSRVKTEKRYLKIYQRNNNNSHLTSIEDCADATERLHQQMRPKRPSLDEMYSSMEESMT